MGSGMPEIGSRISLISKADIRYEGKLFSVDPDECTIALSSVRSYGTEDRKTTYPVPAQHQVYDFILFRGSDIKDIRVLTTTIPNDPAIVQLSVPPSLSSIENQFESADSDFRSNVAGSSGARIPTATSSSARPSQTFQNSGFKSTGSSVFANIDQVMKHSAPHPLSEDGGSRSSTPSHAKQSEAPARTSISSNKSDEHQPQQQRKQQTFDNRDSNRSQYQNRYQNQQQGKPQYQQRYQQNRYPQQQQQQRYPQQSGYRDYNNSRDYNNGREYNGRDYNNRDGQYRNYNQEYQDGYGQQRQYMQPLRGNVQRNENWVNYQQRRPNNRPGQNGGQQNNYQSGGGYQNQNRRPRNTLKFDEEYDFEQANSQFEEVRLQMSKVKLDDAEKVNGDVEKKEDSGNEVSGGEENDHEGVDAAQKDQCYDKVKSFFDNISYEAIERSKGLTARLDWKTERKINSETFGQVALRRNLNNYRRRMNQQGGNNQGGNNGYYNNYQNNRNQGMQNAYRTGYQNRIQGNRPRRQYQAGDQEESKENQVAA